MAYDLEGLLGEDAAIEALLSELARLIQPGPLNIVAVHAVHLKLAALLEDHLAKDAELYHRESGGARGPNGAFAFRLPGLQRDVCAHFARWSPCDILHDATLFCEATRAMLARLRDWVAEEQSRLLPRALQSGRIRLRA